MLEFTVVQAAADPLARHHAARHPDVKWCCLNDETVYWATPDRESSLPDELRLLGGPPQTAQGDLYLVVQVGNAFLSHFPWVRVAVNKGRYLAVDLTAKEVESMGRNLLVSVFARLSKTRSRSRRESELSASQFPRSRRSWQRCLRRG